MASLHRRRGHPVKTGKNSDERQNTSLFSWITTAPSVPRNDATASPIMNRRGGYRPNAGRKKNSGKWGEPTKAIRVPISKLDAIYKLLLSPITEKNLPSSAFPIPPSDDIYFRPLYTAATFSNAVPQSEPTEKFNLNAYLLPHPERMVFVRAPDPSMRDAEIDEGDMLILDTHRPMNNGSIVAAIVNDELFIREVLHDKEGIILAAANPLYSPIHLAGEIHFTLLGVVKVVVREV